MDDYVRINSNSVFNITNVFAISVWVNSPVFATHGNADIVVRSGWWTFAIGSPSPGVLRLYDTAGKGVYLSSTFSNNMWHYIVATKFGPTVNDINIYVDGIQQSVNKNGSWSNAGGNNAVTIGGIGNGYFNGLIDEVRIYNRALSEAEIKAIYNATK